MKKNMVMPVIGQWESLNFLLRLFGSLGDDISVRSANVHKILIQVIGHQKRRGLC